MKNIGKIASALRMVIKYAGIIIVIVDIIGYAAGKLEQYAGEKGAKEGEVTT